MAIDISQYQDDPDNDDEATPADDLSDLELLTQALAPVAAPEFSVYPPARPGWRITLRPNVTQAEISRANRKATTGRGDKAAYEPVDAAARLLFDHTTGIYVSQGGSDHQLTDEAGKPITFKSRDLIADKPYTAKGKPHTVVVEFFGRDADILDANARLLDHAGFDGNDPAEVEQDPTKSA